jgi:hypothetical protein
MKKILIGLLVVVIIVAAGLFYLWQSRDRFIKTAIEEAGSRATQVSVTLNEVDTANVLDGRVALRGLVVGNPAGFNTDSAFKLGEVSVKVDPASVMSDIIVINEVVIAAPQVTYEFAGSGSNIITIQKNVEKMAGGGSGGGASSGDGGGKKVVIDNLYVRDGRVNVSADFLQGKETGTNLPTIHLKDIGKSSGGASPTVVAEQVIDAIAKAATSAVAKLDVGQIKEALQKELGAKMGDVQKKLEQGTGGAGDAIKKGTEDAEKTLKGLFGK